MMKFRFNLIIVSLVVMFAAGVQFGSLFASRESRHAVTQRDQAIDAAQVCLDTLGPLTDPKNWDFYYVRPMGANVEEPNPLQCYRHKDPLPDGSSANH